MITLHSLNQSRALRIVWLLEILGTPYRLQTYRRHPDTLLAPDELKAIHPLGKSPLLDDDGFILAESGAITDYLIQTYGNGHLMPEGSLMPLLLLGLVFRRIESAPMPFFVKPIARKISGSVKSSFILPQAALHLSHIDSELENREWLVGNSLSGADIMMSYPLQAAADRFDFADYPNIRAYLQLIEAHEAYRRAVEKAGSPLLKLDQ